jgi:hypothetical protein
MTIASKASKSEPRPLPNHFPVHIYLNINVFIIFPILTQWSNLFEIPGIRINNFPLHPLLYQY